jgi:hypothetical protein
LGRSGFFVVSFDEGAQCGGVRFGEAFDAYHVGLAALERVLASNICGAAAHARAEVAATFA